MTQVLVAYDTHDDEALQRLAHHECAQVIYDRSHQELVEKISARAPESHAKLCEFGRHWVPPTGLLPSTQAGVHADTGCSYCHGVKSKTFPDGMLQRFYPSDGEHYDKLAKVLARLAEVADAKDKRKPIDAASGCVEGETALTDSEGRALI